MKEERNDSNVFDLIKKYKNEFQRPSKVIVDQAPTELLERRLYIVDTPFVSFVKGTLFSILSIEGTTLTQRGEVAINKRFMFGNNLINFEVIPESNQFIFSEDGLLITICK